MLRREPLPWERRPRPARPDVVDDGRKVGAHGARGGGRALPRAGDAGVLDVADGGARPPRAPAAAPPARAPRGRGAPVHGEDGARERRGSAAGVPLPRTEPEHQR